MNGKRATSATDEQSFYDIIGKMNGWDFSKVKCISEGEQWSFYEEVVKSSSETDILLDIGTGGGEKVLDIASSFSFVVGIDNSSAMIETAKSNLKKSAAANLRFLQESSGKIPFPNGFFDRVSSRHATFQAEEAFRVLKEGGIFLTQQVSEADKMNLKLAFGRGQSLEGKDGSLKERYVEELKAAGFSKVDVREYDAVEYYERPEDLLFLLTHTPIIPDFGKAERDLEMLNEFIEKNQTEKGIRTNSKRFLLVAVK